MFRNKLSKFLLFLIGAVVVRCHHGNGKVDYSIVNTGLTMTMLQALDSDDNAFFSPALITNSLLALANGANGASREQIMKLLSLKDQADLDHINNDSKHLFQERFNTDIDHLTNLTQMMFNDQYSKLVVDSSPVDDKFKMLASETYRTEIQETTDMKEKSRNITKQINNWIKNKTSGRISKLLDDQFLDHSTQMVIMSGAFFKASWVTPFDANQTELKDFNNLSGAKSKVKFMSNEGDYRTMHDESLEADLIEIPFLEQEEKQRSDPNVNMKRKMALVLMVPYAGDVDKLMTKLAIDSKLDKTLKTLCNDDKLARLNLQMPKIRFEKDYELKEKLEELEVKDIFSSTLADFSPIFKSKELPETGRMHLANFLHTAGIEMNERGTSAATIQAASFNVVRSETKKFLVNRPFLMFIVDESKHLASKEEGDKNESLVMFAGRFKTLVNEENLTFGLGI